MENIILIILLAVIVGVLVWVVWRLNGLYKRFSFYTDYAGSVKGEVIGEVLTSQFLQELRNHAQLRLSTAIDELDKQMRSDTAASRQKMLVGLEEHAAQILNGELEQYRQTIAEAKTAAINVTEDTERLLEEARKGIEDQAQAAVREERRHIMHKLDVKLADIITQYLLRALEDDIDLGAQKDYIIAQLEGQKEEIKRDINDEF